VFGGPDSAKVPSMSFLNQPSPSGDRRLWLARAKLRRRPALSPGMDGRSAIRTSGGATHAAMKASASG
jgi:hypothetical protein